MAEREIKTISFGKACRTKIGMYLSADQAEALKLGLREIYVNSLDAFTETNQKKGNINITLSSETRQIKIEDDGPGIPNKVREDGLHSMVAAYTLSHTGSHFDGRATNAIGTNGVGGSIVNHTASEFEISSCDGKTFAKAQFKSNADGAELIKLDTREVKASDKTGVSICYVPDVDVYGTEWFDETELVNELTEMMKFYPKYSICLNYDGHITKIAFPNGLKTNDTKIYYESEELILALGVGEGEIKPFGNRLYLPNGGNFFTQFKTVLTKTVNDLSGLKLTGTQIQKVFNGYCAVFVSNPLFSNQSKTALANKEVNMEITAAVKNGLNEFSQTGDWDRIIKRLEAEMKAEQAAEKARQKILNAQKDFTAKKINTMSDKFIDTDVKDRSKCDLYLAEGDSAGGPIKRTKPREAAVMLLRGKVLNTAREGFDKVVENNELMMIAKGIGASITEDGFRLDPAKARFGKIIVAADSDPDGSHICSLLMTYFYIYFPQLIKAGMLYTLAPRLFKVESKGKEYYFGNEREMNAYLKENKIKGAKISRYKGLGSFDDDEFKHQIEPSTRDLLQIDMKNAERAAEAMKLMDNDVESRKQLIMGELEWE